MDCYVLWNGGAWMVKERTFAEEQSRQNPINLDGKHWLSYWRLIRCVDSFEHARDKARLEWGVRGERWTDPVPAVPRMEPPQG